MKVVCPGWFGIKHEPAVQLEEKPGPGVSHGICPACKAEGDRQLDAPEGKASLK